MPNYYNIVEGGLEPKHIANVGDVNDIQSNISAALVQLISDSLGEAYILDDADDAFLLTPTTTIIDQQNANGSSWKLLKDLYVKQTITLEKTSIENIKIRLKNDYTEAINLTTEIRDLNNDVLESITIQVLNGVTDGEYTLSFNLHHLPPGDYDLILKRTNVGTPTTGLHVKYDNTGSYGQKMSESPDGDDYNELDYDLYFVENYATQSTFDIVSAMALIQGDKLMNLDTHVSIPAASSYGDRIDVVVLRRDGILEVIEGEVSTKPEEPLVDPNLLIIAYIRVYKGQPLATDMGLDQSEIMSRTRTRTPKHRISDLEREVNWIHTYNSPRRVKYNISGPAMFNSSLSTNMVYDTSTGQYILSSNEIVRALWQFKDDVGFTAVNIDHDNHANGTITLAKTTYTDSTWDGGHGGSDRWVGSSKLYVYKNQWQNSRYPGAYFYVPRNGTLKQIGVDLRFHVMLYHGQEIGSMDGAQIHVYNAGGGLIESSNYVSSSNWTMPPDYTLTRFDFSGSNWLSPGWYKWVFVGTPKYSTGIMWPNFWYSYNPAYAGVNNTYVEHVGKYPNPGYEVWRPGRGINQNVVQSFPGFYRTGTITSTATATNAGIATVRADINIKVPNGTSYTLEVSNDGGLTYYQMTGDAYTFSSQTGQSFMWRITLNTNNIDLSPTIFYDEAEMYAIKFTLGLTSGGSPPTTGQFVTSTFDGPNIVDYALGYAQQVTVGATPSVDRFSNWEWLRMWVEENSGSVSVDIETSQDNSSWRIVRSGLSLEEIGQEPTLYLETVEDDEYNYHSDLDIEVLNDQELVDPCEEAWTSMQEADVECTADTGTKVEGLKSAKMAIGAGASTGNLAYHTRDLSLTAYDQIDMQIRSSVAINTEGHLQLVLCSDTAGTTALTTLDIPTLTQNTWTEVTLKLDNPAILGEVKSFALKMTSDYTADIYIDSIRATKLGVTLLEDCEVAWTKDKVDSDYTVTADSAEKVQGLKSCKIYITGDIGTGLIVHKVKSPALDLSEYKTIRFWIKSTGNLDIGDLKFLIGDNTACTTVLESHDIPAILAASGWTRVTIDLNDPSLLTSVESFGIQLVDDTINGTGSIYLDAIEGVRTLEIPFYQKYIRFRFNLSRTDGKDLSPSIRKIGVIPRLM